MGYVILDVVVQMEQLVSPGAFLSDVCLERYQVREKKSSKKVFYSFFIFFLNIFFSAFSSVTK